MVNLSLCESKKHSISTSFDIWDLCNMPCYQTALQLPEICRYDARHPATVHHHRRKNILAWEMEPGTLAELMPLSAANIGLSVCIGVSHKSLCVSLNSLGKTHDLWLCNWYSTGTHASTVHLVWYNTPLTLLTVIITHPDWMIYRDHHVTRKFTTDYCHNIGVSMNPVKIFLTNLLNQIQYI